MSHDRVGVNSHLMALSTTNKLVSIVTAFLKTETSPLMSAISISKQSTWIYFTICVVVTSDMMSLSLEF